MGSGEGHVEGPGVLLVDRNPSLRVSGPFTKVLFHRSGEWDLFFLFAVGLGLSLALFMRLQSRRPAVPIRRDLVARLRDRSSVSVESLSTVTDRAIATFADRYGAVSDVEVARQWRERPVFSTAPRLSPARLAGGVRTQRADRDGGACPTQGFGLVPLLLWVLTSRRLYLRLGFVVFAVVVISVTVSRVGLGAHWASDVVVSFFIGASRLFAAEDLLTSDRAAKRCS